MIPKLGIRFSGTQERFIQLFIDQAKKFGDKFDFYEIGLAEGFTFSGLCKVFKDNNLQGTMVSSDIPNGWSLDQNKLVNNMNDSGIKWSQRYESSEPIKNEANIFMVDGRRLAKELGDNYGFRPGFCFIDACHAKCSMLDFIAVEPYIPLGGVVVFHDAGELEQGTDWQSHCGEYITVRKYLKELGLLNDTRPNWKFLEEISGDRAKGGEGNSHVCVQRIG